MIYLKACEKCGGDVELAQDIYGAYLTCIQCSFTIDSAGAAKRAVEPKDRVAQTSKAA